MVPDVLCVLVCTALVCKIESINEYNLHEHLHHIPLSLLYIP